MDSFEERVEKEYNSFTWGKFIKYGIIIIAIGTLFTIVGSGLGWFSEAAQVAKEEFGPRAALQKYEWFKDASAQLEKKLQDITIQEQKIKDLEDSYEGVKRKDWDRIDKQTYSQFSQELAGVKASYNYLAAEYNSQSSKFNWSVFKSNTDTPPTEYKQLTN